MESYSIWFFCNWLLSLNMFSRFIHYVACISNSLLLWINNIFLYGYNTVCLSVHQLMDIWVVSLSRLLWIMTLLTLKCKFCVDICFYLTWNVPMRGIAGHTINSILYLLRNCQAVFQSTVPFLISSAM